MAVAPILEMVSFLPAGTRRLETQLKESEAGMLLKKPLQDDDEDDDTD